MLSLALLALAAPQEVPLPPEEPFATTTIGMWKGEARTDAVHGRANLPVVRDVTCALSANGLNLWLSRNGTLNVSIHGVASISKDGDEESFSTLSTLWLRVGGVRYETKAVHIGDQPWRFTDIAYPREENDDVILPVFTGYLALRRTPDEPWLPLSGMMDTLSRARSMEIGYRVWDEDGPDNSFHVKRYTIRLTGLGKAIRWCQDEMVSTRAYRTKP